MKYCILFLVGLASVSSVFAGISAKTRMEMNNRTESYFLYLADGKSLKDPEPRECRPSTQECIIFVAGSFASSSDRIQAAKACVGNFGASCAKWAAGSFASFADRVAAAQACRNNRTLDCATFVAGTFASTSERVESASACGDADIACVKYVAGSFSSYSERIAAAKSCSAQD